MSNSNIFIKHKFPAIRGGGRPPSPLLNPPLLLLLLLVPIPCKVKQNHHLCTSSCGNIHNISYPFRLKDDPRSCGESEFELACENNRTIFYLYSRKYRVKEINYEIFTIRVVEDFSSLSLHLSTYTGLILEVHFYGVRTIRI